MKRMIKFQVFGALVLSLAVVFTSCQQEDVETTFPTYGPEVIGPGALISSSGGILSMLDGNVILEFPQGAIDFTEYFKVRICDDPAECKYLLKMISIEPFVTFKKPVKLSITYDKVLMNNPEILCSGISATPIFWDSPQDFLNDLPEKCSECFIDPENMCITLYIMQTGVYAFNKIK